MRVRTTDINGDWNFGHGQLDYATKQKAIEYDICQKINEWFQDCFFALQNGIPWSIRLGSHNQQSLLDNDLKDVIKNVEGVLNILSFSSLTNERRYRADVSIFTIYSTEPLNLTIDSKGILEP